jgi:hypothetical protein
MSSTARPRAQSIYRWRPEELPTGTGLILQDGQRVAGVFVRVVFVSDDLMNSQNAGSITSIYVST